MDITNVGECKHFLTFNVLLISDSDLDGAFGEDCATTEEGKDHLVGNDAYMYRTYTL